MKRNIWHFGHPPTRDPMTESECGILTPSQIDQWRHQIRVSTFFNYHHEMALALLAQEEIDAAIRHLQLVLNHVPSSLRCALLLLELYEKRGKQAEIEALKKSSVANFIDFDTLDALSIGGKALSRQDWNGVPSLPATAQKKSLPTLQVMQEVTALYQMCEPSVRPTPDFVNYELFSCFDGWKTLISSAVPHYFNSGRWADAIRLGTIALNINPVDILTIHYVGMSMVAAGDAASAASLFEEKGEEVPLNTIIELDHAIACLNMGDHARSVEICQVFGGRYKKTPITVDSLLALNGLLFDRPELVEAARPALEAAQKTQSPWVLLPLAVMHQLNGDEQKTVHMLKEFLSIPEMQQSTRTAMALLPESTIKDRLLSALLTAGFTPDFPRLLTPA